MPTKTIKNYKLGAKKQFDGLFEQVVTSYTSNGEKTDFSALLAEIPSINESYDMRALLGRQTRRFKDYLESKGVDSDYDGIWLGREDGSVIKRNVLNATELQDHQDASEEMMHVVYVRRFHSDDHIAQCAASGLFEISMAEKDIKKDDYKAAATHSLRAMFYARNMEIMLMEHQWHIGKSKIENFKENNTKRNKYSEDQRQQAANSLRIKIRAGNRKSDALRRTSNELKISVNTLKQWIKDGKMAI